MLAESLLKEGRNLTRKFAIIINSGRFPRFSLFRLLKPVGLEESKRKIDWAKLGNPY
jgi:hypothetical protein